MVESEFIPVSNCADDRVLLVEKGRPWIDALCQHKDLSIDRAYVEVEEKDGKTKLTCNAHECPFSIGISHLRQSIVHGSGGATIIFNEGGEDGVL
jgi:hypothetical protein